MGRGVLRVVMLDKIEREAQEAKEEHREPGTRRKHQHLRYEF
jgi:hypothetical protein